MIAFLSLIKEREEEKRREANAATTNISITIEVNEMIGFALLAPLAERGCGRAPIN